MLVGNHTFNVVACPANENDRPAATPLVRQE
jgi:hypothetical protein